MPVELKIEDCRLEVQHFDLGYQLFSFVSRLIRDAAVSQRYFRKLSKRKRLLPLSRAKGASR